jgi:hypothetical protein
MAGPFTFPVAEAVPFEPNRNPQWGGNVGPSGIQSTDVQSAIEEAKADALANDRFVILSHYGGNANAGRYTEWYSQEAGDVSPIYLVASANLLGITCQTTAANATCTIGVFDLNVSSVTPAYTVVMTAQKRVSYVGTPLTTFAANALIAMRVLTGSINTPELQVTLSAAT